MCKIFQSLYIIIIVMIFIFSTVYAQDDAELFVKLIKTPDVDWLEVGEGPQEVEIHALTDKKDLTFFWSFEGPGNLVGDLTAPAILYRVPTHIEGTEVEVIITVRITDDQNKTRPYKVAFTLLAPTQTPLPVKTPEPTPTPIPISTECKELKERWNTQFEEFENHRQQYKKAFDYKHADICNQRMLILTYILQGLKEAHLLLQQQMTPTKCPFMPEFKEIAIRTAYIRQIITEEEQELSFLRIQCTSSKTCEDLKIAYEILSATIKENRQGFMRLFGAEGDTVCEQQIGFLTYLIEGLKELQILLIHQTESGECLSDELDTIKAQLSIIKQEIGEYEEEFLLIYKQCALSRSCEELQVIFDILFANLAQDFSAYHEICAQKRLLLTTVIKELKEIQSLWSPQIVLGNCFTSEEIETLNTRISLINSDVITYEQELAALETYCQQ